MIGSLIRQALLWGKKQKIALRRERRARTLPITTRQWLLLTFGIGALVGAIFLAALLYLQSGN